MGVKTNNLEVILLKDFFDFILLFVPYAKTGSGPAYIGAVIRSGSKSGIEANADFTTRACLTDFLKLRD